MIPKFRAWYTPFKGKTIGQEMKYGQAGRLITHAEMAPDKYVLMQSTGLKDKNGVDVYQGDIIRCTRGCPHEVIWLEKYGGTFFGGMPAWYLSGLSNGYSWTGREEVIGNIYENSELLEEQR
ncbi:YopX family protein [Enterococcus durans]|uniref:YopX family protein n=1 Tax=Enterococcus durans TaxID=53345 RepID=UPI0039A525CE